MEVEPAVRKGIGVEIVFPDLLPDEDHRWGAADETVEPILTAGTIKRANMMGL